MEKYYWLIEFSNGEKLCQFNEDKTENKIDFIFLQNHTPFVFHLIPTVENLPIIKILIDNDKRLIYFRKRIGAFTFGINKKDDKNKLLQTLFVCGWQKTINNINIKNLMWIDTEGNILYNCDDLSIKIEE